MAQSVKRQWCKHDDLISEFQNSPKQLGVVTCLDNASAGRLANLISKFQVQREAVPNTKMENN